MTRQFEFELVFALPVDTFPAEDLSDAVFEAGFEDAIVGTGIPGLIAVEILSGGDDAEDVILKAAKEILKKLPARSRLREVRPDLVSLADVAIKLNIKRQALQKRKMPPPSVGGLYRIDEIADALSAASKPEAGQRTPRFNIDDAESWLNAGRAARKINAKLICGFLDPISADRIEYEPL